MTKPTIDELLGIVPDVCEALESGTSETIRAIRALVLAGHLLVIDGLSVESSGIRYATYTIAMDGLGPDAMANISAARADNRLPYLLKGVDGDQIHGVKLIGLRVSNDLS